MKTIIFWLACTFVVVSMCSNSLILIGIALTIVACMYKWLHNLSNDEIIDIIGRKYVELIDKDFLNE